MRAVAPVLTALVVTAFLPSTATAQSSAARAGIDATNRKFEAAWAAKDAAALTALYTSDATVMPPNAPAATGSAAVSALWSQVAPTIPGPLTLTAVEVQSHGEVAHERGTYEIKDGNGTVIDTGKYIVIWKKVGTEWKLFNDIWNSDRPPSGM